MALVQSASIEYRLYRTANPFRFFLQCSCEQRRLCTQKYYLFFPKEGLAYFSVGSVWLNQIQIFGSHTCNFVGKKKSSVSLIEKNQFGFMNQIWNFGSYLQFKKNSAYFILEGLSALYVWQNKNQTELINCLGSVTILTFKAIFFMMLIPANFL